LSLNTLTPLSSYAFPLTLDLSTIQKQNLQLTYISVREIEGMVERVKEMVEMVETALEMGDGMQVHTSFHTVG
jgi:hypothetical protein